MLVRIVVVVPELDQQVFQLAGFQERLEAFVKISDDLVVHFAFVREALVQLGGEEKIRIFRGLVKPRFCGPLERRAIERAVNLHAVHKPADIYKLVNLRACVDDSLPVRVRPARYAYIDLPGHP